MSTLCKDIHPKIVYEDVPGEGWCYHLYFPFPGKRIELLTTGYWKAKLYEEQLMNTLKIINEKGLSDEDFLKIFDDEYHASRCGIIDDIVERFRDREKELFTLITKENNMPTLNPIGQWTLIEDAPIVATDDIKAGTAMTTEAGHWVVSKIGNFDGILAEDYILGEDYGKIYVKAHPEATMVIDYESTNL